MQKVKALFEVRVASVAANVYWVFEPNSPVEVIMEKNNKTKPNAIRVEE
jgi:hypothetical protein